MAVEENHGHNDLVLMDALEFDIHDLLANRAGSFTEHQRDVLNAKRQSWRQLYIVIAILAPVILVAIAADGYRIHDTTSSRIQLSCFALFVLCGLWLYFLMKSKQLSHDLLRDHVAVTEGKARLTKYRARNGTQYSVTIGTTKFGISKRVFRAFVNDKSYRAYYAASSKTLISAEGALDTFNEKP